jgi:hypothetical protein
MQKYFPISSLSPIVSLFTLGTSPMNSPRFSIAFIFAQASDAYIRTIEWFVTQGSSLKLPTVIR